MSQFLTSIPKECVGTNGLGVHYAEFSCLHPLLGATYLPFERFYDPVATLTWMQDRPMIPIIACVAYVVLIVLGRAYMKDRPAWSWRRILAVWNLSLSLFSWIGAIRTAPQLYYNLTTYSLRDNLCDDPAALYGSGSTGLWVQLFILSKFPELLDTFFIVIHKKPLIFLHWYHHITVLLYCWHSYVTTSPSGLFFVVMNYSVHAVMYGYYFLMAVKFRPKWFNPMFVTFMQLSQMFIGVGVTIVAFYYYSNPILGKTCHIRKENNVAAFVMYGSYFYLFAQFFVARYYKVKVKGDAKKKKVV
ncbi:long chain fatty acid elongase [Thalassiosira pseudonana CCMP1335]|uniref:Elongation of fatty acids protein n=1 Tax=Thalassiosira pseudonana TaxID=35128 RepID=B8CBI0_THAPS|nr:long chain fatty acid elongase [Thalassiosira pseudonana CCMP1335]EED89131.1 long chain fatty acid elongase [Thalassiosira pseudonana CCMP1335]|mmetsp:Transcript_15757/g.34032  ORF Transcript_15757/g.34032 Transcript_15757/m.34032 type:complete len:302 (+) Transcript_15757:90-995(+)|eukprot:scaffold1102_cov195-Alexandrium_tamarense.AAC.10